MLFSFLPAKNGNYIHKVKKLINGLGVENTGGQNNVMLEEVVIVLQLKCDQYS